MLVVIYAYKIDWKLAFGRPRSRQEDNIKINLKRIGCKGVDWIHLAQDIVCGGIFSRRK
jgi:hypothetical protein